jgi:trigger factor
MQITETTAEGLKREFKITVPAGDIDAKISDRLGEIGRTIRLPGFRPGKVPMQLLQRRFGPAVRGEVLESAVQESSAEAIQEHKIRPALPPKVEIVSAAEGADLEYTMSVETLPDLPEPDFSNLGLERLVVEVPDEEIDKAIERMAENQRKSEIVDRPAESGDIVVADTVGRVAGEELPGSRGEGREIELGAEGLLPGFTEQLLGVNSGETRNVTVTFPAESGNPDLAGKEAVFEVAVKEVRQRMPAAIDDSLAEAVGFENLAELRQEFRQRMQREYEGLSRQRLKRVLLDKLAERYEFPVPPGMLEIEFENIWGQYQAERQMQKEAAAAANSPEAAAQAGDAPVDGAATIAPEETALEGASDREPAGAEPAHPEEPEQALHHARPHPGSAEEPLDAAAVIAPEETALEGASDTEPAAAQPEPDPDEEKAREEYRRLADRRVRLGLLLAEVGRSNNITVTQDELNQALAREARRHPGYERQVIDYYRKNPDAVNNLRAPIFEEKVVDFIVELAKPEERKVTPEELVAAVGADGGDGEGKPE